MPTGVSGVVLREVLTYVGGELTGDAAVIYECRRCGTAVGSENDACPYCGRCDIARYEIR